MVRSLISTILVTAVVLPLWSCGGAQKKEPKPVTFKTIEPLGVKLKIPETFKKNPAGGSDAVQYLYKGGQAIIAVEKTKLDEGGLEALYKKEYEKRQRDTRKARKSQDAYEIIKKEDTTFGGKKAFVIEQEFLAGDGTMRAHNIVINIDLGDNNLLTVKWEVADVKEKGMSWDKFFPRYFKESRSSFSMK